MAFFFCRLLGVLRLASPGVWPFDRICEFCVTKTVHLADFRFELPDELIARYPMPERTASRLLIMDGNTGELDHQTFKALPTLLQAGDLLVFNNTRVIAARLFGRKATGGKIEILIERVLGTHEALAHVRASKSPKAGALLLLEDEQTQLQVLGRQADLFHLRAPGDEPLLAILERLGHIPLPPYIDRQDQASDRERYQTVYAQKPGAVAAPTAGLHFDQAMLDTLAAMGVNTAFVTLHVGAGTFAPVRVENIETHRMHSEYAEVDEAVVAAIKATQAQGGRVIAVGTTSLRSLESAAQAGDIAPFRDDTSIFIYPGYVFKCVDALITNFHLPESTLLMLVSAFAGHENIQRAYREAVNKRYRFFSYGDAMFLTRRTAKPAT